MASLDSIRILHGAFKAVEFMVLVTGATMFFFSLKNIPFPNSKVFHTHTSFLYLFLSDLRSIIRLRYFLILLIPFATNASIWAWAAEKLYLLEKAK